MKNILDDHAKLACLEWRYETERLLKRACMFITGGVLALTAYVFLQIAIVQALKSLGASLGEISLGLMIVHGALSTLVVSKFGHRDPRAGKPFQGTLEELNRNSQWIRKFFS